MKVQRLQQVVGLVGPDAGKIIKEEKMVESKQSPAMAALGCWGGEVEETGYSTTGWASPSITAQP